MKNKLSKAMSILLVLVMAISLTACGETKKTESPSTEGSSNTGNESSKKEDVVIKIAWWGGQSRHDYTQKLLDKYTELNPNVKFEALPSGWDGYFDKLSIQAASSTMPDIVQMDYLYISTYAKNNAVVDLQEYIDNGTIDVSNIDPVLYEAGRINDKLAGMVLSSSLLTVGYNPDVFAEAGILEPEETWTWNDFITMSKTIKETTGKYGFGAIMADDTNNFNYYVRQHGEKLFSEDNKSLGYSDDQVFIDFVNMTSELIDVGAIPTPDEYNTIKGLGIEASPVATGASAMVTDWSNLGVRVAATNENIKLINPPYGEDGTKGLWLKPGMFFSIANNSKVKDEAAKFINWFINSKEANEIIMAERGTPVSSEIRDYLKTSNLLTQKQIEMFEYVDGAIKHSTDAPAPDPTGISEINEAFYSSVYSVLYGQEKVEDAAARFRSEANSILERNN